MVILHLGIPRESVTPCLSRHWGYSRRLTYLFETFLLMDMRASRVEGFGALVLFHGLKGSSFFYRLKKNKQKVTRIILTAPNARSSTGPYNNSRCNLRPCSANSESHTHTQRGPVPLPHKKTPQLFLGASFPPKEGHIHRTQQPKYGQSPLCFVPSTWPLTSRAPRFWSLVTAKHQADWKGGQQSSSSLGDRLQRQKGDADSPNILLLSPSLLPTAKRKNNTGEVCNPSTLGGWGRRITSLNPA